MTERTATAETGQPPQGGPPALDSGLAGLSLLAKFFEKPGDYDQLRHAHGDPSRAADEIDLLRAAKAIGFKASALSSEFARLARTPLPALARHRDGGWFILAKVAPDQSGAGKVLIQDPRVGRPEEPTPEQLVERWDGRLLLVATSRPNHPRPVGRHRRHLRPLLPAGVPQLLRRCRNEPV